MAVRKVAGCWRLVAGFRAAHGTGSGVMGAYAVSGAGATPNGPPWPFPGPDSPEQATLFARRQLLPVDVSMILNMLHKFGVFYG